MTSDAMTRQAACCCGSVTLTVKGEPVLHAVCHCDNCKKRTGSAFGISVYFRDEAIVARNGPTSIYVVDNRERRHQQERHFCPRCGSTVFWKISTMPGITGIAGGCFSGMPLPSPGHNLCAHQQCDWLRLPDSWHTALRQQDIAALTQASTPP